jgi:antitoxin YefM
MAITASEARKKLFPLIDQVNDDQEPVEIVSRRGSAYLVSESQFRSLVETAYLLRSPANAARLLESIASLEKGAGQLHDLVDVPDDELDHDQEPVAALAVPAKKVQAKKVPAKKVPAKKTPAKKVTTTEARTYPLSPVAASRAIRSLPAAAKAPKPSRG